MRAEGSFISIEDLTHTHVVVLVLAFMCAVDNKLASNLVLMPTPGLARVYREVYPEKSWSQNTALLHTIYNGIIPSTWAVPCMFSWSDLVRSSKIGGHPTFLRIVKSASRFT